MIVIWLVVAVVAVASAILVVALDNPVHSALCLVVSLLCIAAMYAMLNAPFLAVTQVSVYAGAIMVLFVFVIMLLNPGRSEGGSRHSSWAVGGSLVVCGVVLLTLAGAVLSVNGSPSPIHGAAAYIFGSPQHVGRVLFSVDLIPFEATSLLLTVAMVGAILLARRKF